MISNAPRHAFAAPTVVADAVEDSTPRFITWVLAWLQHTVCALHGHDAILQYERDRIFLRCTSCGHETPGWDVAHNAALRHPLADARSGVGSPPELVVARKIA